MEIEIKENFHLGVIGTLAILLSIISGTVDETWFLIYKLPVFLLSISLYILFIALWFELIFKEYTKYTSVKIWGALLFSLLLIYANALSSKEINNVFGIDSSAFPYTQLLITALEVFILLKPVFIIVFFIGILSFISDGYNCYAADRNNHYIEVIFSIGSVLAGGYLWFVITTLLNEEELPLKIYKTAHIVDFKRTNVCTTDINDSHSVIYIGTNHKNVLVDESNISIGTTRKFLYEKRSENSIPDKFFIRKCID